MVCPKLFQFQFFKVTKTDCKGIVEDAIKRAKKDDIKNVFVVFDHDNQANRKDAFELANKKDVKIYFSSICFEIWYFFHFKNSTRAFSSEAELEIELKKCNGFENYSKTDFKHYSVLKDKLSVAKNHSKTVRELTLENNFGIDVCHLNPYTNIDELVEYLQEQKSKS